MPSSSDRNLLFGIIALQMDFVSRDQLIAGMQSWLLAKDKSLAEHLVQQGGLKAQHRQLLEPLVEAHVRAHHNDPQQSLAALSSIGSLRTWLEAIADPPLAASLAHVSQAPAAARDPADTLSATVSPHSPGARFRILRYHAEGGLGKVFVAHDQELGREVALKEIKPAWADSTDSRARFVLEAEITGGLEHPGIVPVYSLGTYADGRPFYAMRFVRGASLREAVDKYHAPSGAKARSADERNLELRRLLGRLIDVCHAIHYAHSRGVLHRDLKPGNIMLGKYGETLVVDWGLARLHDQPTPWARTGSTVPAVSLEGEAPLVPRSDSGSEKTALGSAVGTPAFMSPEQAQGRLDQLGPATDVFSLGATLYAILTGRPPYEGEQVLEQARQAAFAAPRLVNREIPRPLESICLKAMATQPEDRYGNTRQLADDLERWLADERVSAHREDWPARLWRLARRHRSWGMSLAAALVLIALVSTVSAYAVNAARLRERAARQVIEAIELQTRLADARLRAEETRGRRGESEVASSLRQASRAELQDLSSQLAALVPPQSRAWIHIRRANILLEYNDNREELVQAGDDYRQAARLFSELLKETQNEQTIEQMLVALDGQSQVALSLGDGKDFTRTQDEALKLCTQAAQAFPRNERWDYWLDLILQHRQTAGAFIPGPARMKLPADELIGAMERLTTMPSQADGPLIERRMASVAAVLAALGDQESPDPAQLKLAKTKVLALADQAQRIGGAETLQEADEMLDQLQYILPSAQDRLEIVLRRKQLGSQMKEASDDEVLELARLSSEGAELADSQGQRTLAMQLATEAATRYGELVRKSPIDVEMQKVAFAETLRLAHWVEEEGQLARLDVLEKQLVVLGDALEREGRLSDNHRAELTRIRERQRESGITPSELKDPFKF